MKEVKKEQFSLWKFENLSVNSSIEHFVSGKLNLSFKTGEVALEIKKNRDLLAETLGITPTDLIIPDQTHSTNIGIIRNRNEILFSDTDALITNLHKIYIAVMSADCVPILMFDEVNHVIAAVHSGWKGTVNKILEKTIQTMISQFDSNPINIKIGIGPSISSENYEIGETVEEKVENTFGLNGKLFLTQKNGKNYFNLWEANIFQAKQLGIPEKNIELSGICTFSNEHNFYSARKSGINTGRFAAGIMLK